jgi:hypothetical protein
LVAACLGGYDGAAAQDGPVILAGRIASSVDGIDVEGVLVSIPTLRKRAWTDAAGVFRLEGIRQGTHQLTFRRIGYHRGARSVNVQAESGLFDLGTFLIAPAAVQLDDVVVSATADRYRRLEGAGFYTRWESGAGGFADIDDLDGWGLVDFTDVLRHMPGFRIERNRRYGYPLPDITTAFGIVVETDRGTDYRRYLISSRRSQSEDCPPQIVLDGVRMGSTEEFQIDNLNTETIVGVETYASAAEVPIEFNWGGANCGVIVVWTQ